MKERKTMRAKITKNAARSLKGIAGVHFVVAQLSLQGFIALPTTRNLKSFDVVAFRQDMSNAAYIQVKSTDNPKSGWPVFTVPAEANWRAELDKAVNLGKRFFYIFVELPNYDKSQPSYYVVPSRDVAKMLKKGLADFLKRANRPKPGKQLLAWRCDEPKAKQKYENNWSLLDRRVDG